MHIVRMGIQGPPLGDVRFEFDEKVNLFIGPNGVGKSTILRAMNYSFSLRPADWGTEIDLPGSKGKYMAFYLEPSEDWIRTGLGPDELPDPRDLPDWDTVPLVYVPATRVDLPFSNFPSQSQDELAAMHTEHPLGDLYKNDRGNFYSHHVERGIAFLTENLYEGNDQREQFIKALKLGLSCTQYICSEVITDDILRPSIVIQRDEISDSEQIVRPAMGIAIGEDALSLPLYAGALSSGTQGTLFLIWDIALRLVNLHRWQNGWENHPAILLIDEIENHLHPTWQRRVIPALLEHFPGLQIFATTHSPFVVAGLKAGQVHLLNRNENGVITATTNEQDIIGWTADEILRTFMGVDDPTDDETAAAARELRQLRDEGPRQEPLDEEQRRERMRELRQLVDRDLLAGGPAAAQEELFEQQFAEALEKYRQSRNLNQENS